MGETLQVRRVDWGPLFVLGWIGAVVLGAVVSIAHGLVPSDSVGAALLVLVVGPLASVVYVACGLVLAVAARWLGTTVVGRLLRDDTRRVSPLRVFVGLVVAGGFALLLSLGAMALRTLAIGDRVAGWLGPHFHNF